MIRQFWAWYKRIGQPIEFYTALPVTECRQRLRAATSEWDIPYQITFKGYSAKINPDNTFLLQQRFGFSIRARRPFVGKMETTPGGGTHITGYIENSTSFLGFLVGLTIVAPLGMFYFHGTTGMIAALVVCAALIFAAFFAHYAEKDSKAAENIRKWLYKLLEGDSTVIEMTKGEKNIAY